MEPSQTPALAPWDQQPNETPKSWYAFCLYRNMLPTVRSLAKVAETLGHVQTVLVQRWSTQYDWVARVRSWDQHVQEQATELAKAEHMGALRAMLDQQFEIASDALAISKRMLGHAAVRLRNVEAAAQMEWEKTYRDVPIVQRPPVEIPMDANVSRYVNSALKCADQATNAQAVAMGLDRMVSMIEPAHGDG